MSNEPPTDRPRFRRRARRVVAATAAALLLGALVYFGIVPYEVDRRANAVVPGASSPASAAASRLHRRLQVVDLHSDALLWNRDPLQRNDRGGVDVPRLVDGRVVLQVFSVATGLPRGGEKGNRAGDFDVVTPLVIAQRWPLRTWTSWFERALYQAGRFHDAVARSDGRLASIRSAADLDGHLERWASDPSVAGGLLAIEGMHALEGKLENLDRLFESGFRMMGLTHFHDNELAGSAHGVAREGLTDLGRRAVRRMERLGMVLDLAHLAPRAIDEVLDLATRPVVVSHTGVQATCPGPRNVGDAHIRRIAEGGGVIGIGFFEWAVCDVRPEAIVRAMRHVADLVGVEHVALGSDFDGGVRTGFDAATLDRLTDALLEGGFSEDEIALIMGGNALRVLAETLPR